MGTGTFERLAAEGAAHTLAGSHTRESRPVEGGPRWSVSCLLLPGDDLAGHLDAVAGEAARLAGDTHWRTGARGFAHVTVRALEHHRAQVPADDETVARYVAALRRAAARCGPVSLRVAGLILTPATLVDWVAARRHPPLGELTATEAHLARYQWVEGPGSRGMQPVVLERVPLAGAAGRLRP